MGNATINKRKPLRVPAASNKSRHRYNQLAYLFPIMPLMQNAPFI